MSDNSNIIAKSNEDDASNFSFRMFDLYKRFVDILQLNTEYLKDFQTGHPKEATCRSIIKKVFQFRQAEDKIQQMVNYLTKNCKLLVLHTEKPPNTWNEAIRYTEWCIKVIHTYLKENNIDTKADIDSYIGLAEDISLNIYKNPTKQQIETVREYLIYDIRNPKKDIKSSNGHKKSKGKSKKLSKSNSRKSSGENENKNGMQSSEVTSNHVPSGEIYQLNEIIVTKQENPKNESIDNEEDSPEQKLAMIFGEDNDYSITQEKSSNDSCQENLMDVDKFHDSGYVTIRNSEYCESATGEYVIVEVPGSETFDLNEKSSELTAQPKRKQFEHENGDKPFCKKLFLTRQEGQYLAVQHHNNYDSERILVSNTMDDKSFDSGKDLGIIHTGITFDEPNHKSQKTQIQVIPAQDIEVKQEAALGSRIHYQNEINYDLRYLEISDMTYAQALKLTDKLLAFCEMKNEISLEEFLVLRRTRDKMHWRSLRENKNVK